MLSEYSRDSMKANEMKDGDADDFLDFCKNRKESHTLRSLSIAPRTNDHMTFNANICERKITKIVMLFPI